MTDCWYCLERRLMGVKIEQLRGELNVYKNSNRHYRKIIKDLTSKVEQLEREIIERGLTDDK